MAGSFGFEADKYDVSVKIGERTLLPAVRNAVKDTLIITDGFSCYQQIEGLTGRKALHIAEVLQMAIQSGRRSQRRVATDSRKKDLRRSAQIKLLATGGRQLVGES